MNTVAAGNYKTCLNNARLRAHFN